MAMERSGSTAKQLDLLDLEKALQLLTYKIANIENDILIRHKIDKNKLLDDLAPRYQNELFNLTNELTSISKRLFQNTAITHVKPYKQDSEAPESYRAYLNAAQNVADLVCYDILMQLDGNLAVIVMERWVWVLKYSFETNDFFIASSIINALGTIPVLRLHLEEKLSQTARAILHYFEDLMPNQKAVYEIQKSKFENGEEVVPILSTLTKMMDGFDQQPINDDDSKKIETYCFIKKKKSRISLDFIDMQERLKTVLSDNTLQIIALLSIAFQKDIIHSLPTPQRKIEIDMLRLVAQIKLYLPIDDYYSHQWNLKLFLGRLNGLANDFKASQEPSKSDLFSRKCMGIKNILLDDEMDLNVKLKNIEQMKSDAICKTSKKIMAMLNEIEKTMAALIEIEERKKWQGTPRNSRTSSGGQLSRSGFFIEKQYDSPSSGEKHSSEGVRHAKS